MKKVITYVLLLTALFLAIYHYKATSRVISAFANSAKMTIASLQGRV